MTNNADFYFQSYQEWRNALTQRCNIKITPEYARERVTSLENADDPHTREFKDKYGEAYLNQVIAWFKKDAGW